MENSSGEEPDRPGNEQLLQQPTTVPADSSAYTHSAYTPSCCTWKGVATSPQDTKPSHTHFSSCVLACSSLTSACTLSTCSSSFLMVYTSCCFSSNSDAAAEFIISSTWHLTEQQRKTKSLIHPVPLFLMNLAQVGVVEKELIWKAYFDEEKRNTK